MVYTLEEAQFIQELIYHMTGKRINLQMKATKLRKLRSKVESWTGKLCSFFNDNIRNLRLNR